MKTMGMIKMTAVGVFVVGMACAVRAATTFTWQPTTGGDLADGANWNQSGVAPGGSTSDAIKIEKNQSAPLTLSADINLKDQYNNYFNFSGEFDFGSLSRTLRTGRTFQQSNNKTTKLTRGTLYLGSLYLESGNSGCYNNTFIVDGSESKLQASVYVGSKHRNNKVVVTNGATVAGAEISVGRDAILNSNGTVASNNLFRATGTGTTVTMTGTLSTGIRQDNRIEILDHAVVTANAVKLAASNYDNADATAGGARHIYDSGKRLLVTGGAKLVCNPTGVFKDGHPRLTVGWSTGSNTVEIADGGELVCYTNRVVVGNYWSSSEGTTTITSYDPAYRFAGNRLRVTGKDSKVRIYSAASTTGVFVGQGSCMDDQRIEVLDGASWYSSGEFWISSGCSNGVYIGKNARFEHAISAVQIGIGAGSSNAFFTVDGGVYAPKVGTAVGVGGYGARFDIVNGGVAAITNKTITVGDTGTCGRFTVGKDGLLLASNATLYVSNNSGASNNVFAVVDGGQAIFTGKADHSISHVIGQYCSSTAASMGGTILVEGAGSLLDMSDDEINAVKNPNNRNGMMIVRNGGTMKFYSSYWGDQGTTTNNCGIVVSNGTLAVGSSINLGGSDGNVPHGCWMQVAGTNSDLRIKSMNVNNDSVLAFDVPRTGYVRTPMTVTNLVFGTKCSVRPTLKVTMDPRNMVKYVTLVEAENDITLPSDLTLDLPPKAKVLKAGDANYDAKKLTVKLPTCHGMAIVVG